MGILQECYDARELNKLKLLLELGHDPNEMNEFIIGAIFRSVDLEEHIQLIELMLDYGSDINNNNKLLHCIGGAGSPLIYIELAELLIEKGADIHSQDNYGNTLLHKFSNVSILELFVSKKADVNAKNNKNETPVFRLSKLPPNYYNVKTLIFFIQAGTDFNVINTEGLTFLHKVIIENDAAHKILKWLIKYKPDINLNICDAKGATPLHHAYKHQKTECIEFLIAHEANVHATDKNGLKPHQWAI